MLQALTNPDRASYDSLSNELERWKSSRVRYNKKKHQFGRREDLPDSLAKNALEKSVCKELETHLGSTRAPPAARAAGWSRFGLRFGFVRLSGFPRRSATAEVLPGSTEFRKDSTKGSTSLRKVPQGFQKCSASPPWFCPVSRAPAI